MRSVADIRGSRQANRLMMLTHAVTLRGGGIGTVHRGATERTLRRRHVPISTGQPLLFRRTMRRSDAGRVALFHRRRSRTRLNRVCRRWCRVGGLVDGTLRERCWCTLGDVRVMITRVVLSPLRDDRLRLPIVGGLVGRSVRRREHLRRGEGRSADAVELLVHRTGGMWLLRWLHMLQLRRRARRRGMRLMVMVVIPGGGSGRCRRFLRIVGR